MLSLSRSPDAISDDPLEPFDDRVLLCAVEVAGEMFVDPGEVGRRSELQGSPAVGGDVRKGGPTVSRISEALPAKALVASFDDGFGAAGHVQLLEDV
jgi:hypothetical protein